MSVSFQKNEANLITNKKKTISPLNLWLFCANTLDHIGVVWEEANAVADALVEADLRGVYSHGSALLPMYVERVLNGEIAKDADYKVEKDAGAVLLLNANNGFGHVSTKRAMRIARTRALEHGIALVGVKGSNHFGMAAHYAMKALPDMIGVVLTISNINTMAPWGGLDVLLGNNPIAIAVPAGKEFPVVYDGAFSVAARRKIHLATTTSGKIPPGWALDKNGNQTTSAKEALDGILLPIGAYKGYAMAFMISLLAGVLTGATFGGAVCNHDVGHLVAAINIESFQDPDIFKASVDSAVCEIHNSRKAPGTEKIFVPGERGFLKSVEQKKNGIVLSEEIVVLLENLSKKFAMEPPKWVKT